MTAGGQDNKRENQVPKGEQPPVFRYSREERLSLPGAPRRSDGGGRGLFRRNRTLLIILLDLIIILVLGLFLVRFLYSQTYKADIEGYLVQLSGFRYDEVVFATLKVKNTGRGEANRSVTDGRIYARFSLERSLREADSTFASSALPEPAQEETVLRAAISVEGEPEVLYAEVRIGETVRRLSCGLGH
jgi:hypothetical protein